MLRRGSGLFFFCVRVRRGAVPGSGNCYPPAFFSGFNYRSGTRGEAARVNDTAPTDCDGIVAQLFQSGKYAYSII